MNKYADHLCVLFSYKSKPLMCNCQYAMGITYHDVGGAQTQGMRWVMMQVTHKFIRFISSNSNILMITLIDLS